MDSVLCLDDFKHYVLDGNGGISSGYKSAVIMNTKICERNVKFKTITPKQMSMRIFAAGNGQTTLKQYLGA
jgi:hypothetical protein